jgi:LAS superfamily LD-carboxypeptidase LdcB
MYRKKPILVALLVLLIIATGCSYATNDQKELNSPTTTTTLNTKGVAVLVNEEPIYEKDLDAAIANSEKTSKIWGGPSLTREQVLKGKIWSIVMKQEAKRQRISVSRTELSNYTKDQLREFDKMSADIKEKMEKAAKAYGFKSYKDQLLGKDWQEHFRLGLALDKLDQKRREKAAEIEIPPIPFNKYQDDLVKKANVKILIPPKTK